jgi:CRISPR-associated protein Csy3
METAKVLAFERKLDPSDGLFYAGKWKDINVDSEWVKIPLREKQVRGTISNRLKGSVNLDAEVKKPNLQRVDIASLPSDCDTLRVVFTLRVLGGVGVPSACDNPEYYEKLKEVTSRYVSETGLSELAKRYAQNIASGRFLWRNRLGVESVKIVTEQMEDGKVVNSWEFNAFEYSLREFAESSDKFAELADVIRKGLCSEESFVLLRVKAYVRMGEGQEVYPSQELSLDKSNAKGEKSKYLYEVDGTAGMHSQKIGNAIRTIDTWYPDYDKEEMPIAVEPYGSVTSMGRAFRQKTDKVDFYNLLDNWMLKDKVPDADQQNYVMAVFVRGGVFGDGGKE